MLSEIAVASANERGFLIHGSLLLLIPEREPLFFLRKRLSERSSE